MSFLLYIYILVSVLTSIVAFTRGELSVGLVGLLAPNLCWFAGSGIRGSLMVGTRSQILAGCAMGVASIAIAIGLSAYFGYALVFVGYKVAGIYWCCLGLVVGWLAVTRRDAERPVLGHRKKRD